MLDVGCGLEDEGAPAQRRQRHCKSISDDKSQYYLLTSNRYGVLWRPLSPQQRDNYQTSSNTLYVPIIFEGIPRFPWDAIIRF
ncbi:hypothetical protein EVAR_48362_1 [Eumeta japonica]|uniref:Uncharacterized protein n=1 Tax=Eumeta variegata TaxID=151549 RepID=A0A4C1WLT8_EUMVA|nr:hypothetical protein EVAR_48362_1 [Eumeta japonica]